MLHRILRRPGLNIFRFPVASQVADNRDVDSGSDADSDLEDEEEVEGLEVAETPTPKSL